LRAQNFRKIFVAGDLLYMGTSVGLFWVFVVRFDLGLVGVSLVKFALEFVNLVWMACSWARLGNPTSFGKETLSQIYCTKEILGHIKLTSSGREWLGYLGFEIPTILCGIYGDYNITRAWVVLQIFIRLLLTGPRCLSETLRASIELNLSDKQFPKAKLIAAWAVTINFILCMIPAVLIGIFKKEITAYFTPYTPPHSPCIDFHSALETNIMIYSFIGPFDACIQSLQA
jgi:Na+-driven multidrug efflux pump